MIFQLCSFSSGSSGNSCLIRTENTAVLVDAGISARRITDSLQAVGLTPDDVNAVLITHEHYDHVSGLRVLAGRIPGAKVFANIGTWRHIADKVPGEMRTLISAGTEFTVGDITVRPFSLSHDAADPVGFSFRSGGAKICVITDTGYLTEEMMNEARDADMLVLEANHETGVLECGRYPYALKKRILGDRGHLSNVAAGEALAAVCANRIDTGAGALRVLLAHLSRENNSPELALITVKNILEEAGVAVGRDVLIDVINRDEMSAVYEI